MKDPTSLEQNALKLWDELVARGSLIWRDNQAMYHQSGPITFEIRVSPTLRKKPIYPPYASLHEEQEAIAAAKPPFSDPKSDPTTLIDIGPDHTLVLNKYSFLRPQFVLHTTRFEPQEEPLTHSDFTALKEVLTRLGDEDFIAFFNCGGTSGASVNHKHIQMLRRPPRDKMTLWPDTCRQGAGTDGEPQTNPEIPFKHLVAPLPRSSEPALLLKQYLGLCQSLDLTTEGKPGPHNFIMCSEWMAVVPRSKPRLGSLAVNAMGMLGMIWCGTDEQKAEWLTAGPFDVICQLGVRV